MKPQLIYKAVKRFNAKEIRMEVIESFDSSCATNGETIDAFYDEAEVKEGDLIIIIDLMDGSTSWYKMTELSGVE